MPNARSTAWGGSGGDDLVAVEGNPDISGPLKISNDALQVRPLLWVVKNLNNYNQPNGAYGLFSGGSYNATDAPSAPTLGFIPFKSTLTVGDVANAPIGTTMPMFLQQAILRSGNANNEHSIISGTQLNSAPVTPGKDWGLDLSVHGSIGVQQTQLNCGSFFMANYYNGAPSGASCALSISTKAASGGGTDAAHLAATTYPITTGLSIQGTSSGGTGRAFETGIRIGGDGTDSPWLFGLGTSKIGIGISIEDWDGGAAIIVKNRIAGNTNPDLHSTALAGSDRFIDAFISGEANPRMRIFHDGTIRNGVGGGVAPTQVLGLRKTGWTAATGTATRTTFDTASVTLGVLAEHVKALIDDLMPSAGHGLIGP